MENYTFREYTAMRLILGETSGSGAAAVRSYAQRCLNAGFGHDGRFTSPIVASGRPVLMALVGYTAEEQTCTNS